MNSEQETVVFTPVRRYRRSCPPEPISPHKMLCTYHAPPAQQILHSFILLRREQSAAHLLLLLTFLFWPALHDHWPLNTTVPSTGFRALKESRTLNTLPRSLSAHQTPHDTNRFLFLLLSCSLQRTVASHRKWTSTLFFSLFYFHTLTHAVAHKLMIYFRVSVYIPKYQNFFCQCFL